MFSFSFVLPTEVILSAILFPIKSPVASAVFCTTLLVAVFAVSIPVFVAVSINFFLYLSHFYNVYLIINMRFTLSSISSAMLV